MAVESSLGKLQRTVDKQENEIIKLKDKLAEITGERDLLKLKLKKLEEDFEKKLEEKVNKAVEQAVSKVTKHYEEIIKKKDQRIFELECRLNITSETSSLPSSKDPLYKSKIQNSREKTDKSIGGQPKHKKHQLEKFKEEEITEEVIHEEEECPNCHSKDLTTKEVKERDELDYEIIIKKRRHKFITKKCENCNAEIKCEIPENLHAENQYGSNVKTLALMLYNYGFVSYKRTRDFIYGLTNEEINPSEGYMVKLQQKVGKSLEDFTFDVGENIKKSKLVQWDDTVVRIGEKEKACYRAYTNRKVVLYKAHLSKDTKGMDEDGILQNLSEDTVVVHDHLLHNYCKDYKYQNAECNAHIDRKLKGITVNTEHNWSDEMERLLKETLQTRKDKLEHKITEFTLEELNTIEKKYDEIVEKGFIEYKEFKHKYEYEKEENLLEFLRDYKPNILYWTRDFSIPYSNNFVESLLRMIKSKMKISYQFKSLEQAQYFANIRSYAETCGNYGINRACALKRLLDGNPYTVSELEALEDSQEQ